MYELPCHGKARACIHVYACMHMIAYDCNHYYGLPLASYPGPLIEGEEKGPGTYCTRMRQYPKKTWGAANDCKLFRSPLAPRVRSDVISV